MDTWPDLTWPGLDAVAAEARAFAAGWAGQRASLATILGSRGLIDAASVAVVTGQQSAVGGGPFYTLVKIAHACALAGQLRQRGVLAQPVFWCASEDHDAGEASHADLIKRSGDLRRVSVALPLARASLRFCPASSWWDALVERCRNDLSTNISAATWLDARRPQADEGMGAWLCRLVEELFSAHGLICVEAHRLRPLWRDVMDQALTDWPTAALAATRQAVLAAGHQDAFGPLLDPPVFMDASDGRRLLTLAEAQRGFAADVDRLSPGAALRPLFQQAALPAALYVAGPGECAYHRFLAPLHAHFGLPRQRLVPRCSLTLLPIPCRRAITRWGGTVADILAGGHAPTRPSPAATVLAGFDAELEYLRIEAETAEVDRQNRLRAGHRRLSRERDRLARSLARSDLRAAGLPPWGSLASYLLPRGQRQERSLSLFQVLWENGPEIAERLVTAAREAGPAGQGVVEIA